jgi:hypothetical protein
MLFPTQQMGATMFRIQVKSFTKSGKATWALCRGYNGKRGLAFSSLEAAKEYFAKHFFGCDPNNYRFVEVGNP